MSDLTERLDEILRLGLTMKRAPALRESIEEIERLREQLSCARKAAIEECAHHLEQTGLRNPHNIARDLRALLADDQQGEKQP